MLGRSKDSDTVMAFGMFNCDLMSFTIVYTEGIVVNLRMWPWQTAP